MFLNEPTIVGTIADWENILRHFAETYKKKYQLVGTKELNDVIKAAIDQMEDEKAANQDLDREAANAVG